MNNKVYKKINVFIGLLFITVSLFINDWIPQVLIGILMNLDKPRTRIVFYSLFYFCKCVGILVGFIIIRKRKIIDTYSLILLFCIPVVLFPVLLEVYARFEVLSLFQSPYPFPDKNVEIMEKENFPDMSEFLKDRKNARGYRYYDYHYFAFKPFTTKTVTFTDYFSARNVPDSVPLGKGDLIIWIFGGSTMENFDISDEYTIANQFAKKLLENNISATVFNFGVSAFQSSLESIKFQEILRRVKESEIPDIVIFYDGFNDSANSYISGAGNMQYTFSNKLKTIIEGNNKLMFNYYLTDYISRYSAWWRKYSGPFIQWKVYGKGQWNGSSQNLHMAVNIYSMNTRMIRAICNDFDITPVFILQPMIFTKTQLTDFEKSVYATCDTVMIKFMKDFYSLVRQSMGERNDFYDLSGILNTSIRNDFYDYGHNGPYTSVTIGEEIAKIVREISIKQVIINRK